MTTPTTTRRPASMADVAALANVSMQTVSRVANGLDNVQPQTRQRVEDAMRQLGYRPNRAARALRSGRFDTIGVILFTLSSFGNMRTLEGIAAAAAEADYSIVLMTAAHRTERDMATAFARLKEQAVDGVIVVMEAHLLDESDVALPDGLPVVLLTSTNERPVSVVDTDQAEGARLATEHLLALGHETVWHVSGPDGSYSADHREAAWRQVLEAAGRPVPPVLRGDWTTGTGYRIGREIAARDDITAVFASNDQMALGILRACHEVERTVPASLSIVGFDDMAEADSFWPPLTTVHQSFDRLGRASIDLLVRQIEGDPTPEQRRVATRLVVRDSTAPPPAR